VDEQHAAVIVNIQRSPAPTSSTWWTRQETAAATARLAAQRHRNHHSDGPHHHHPRVGGDVQFELMLTIALVVMVIFLFLRTFAATIIPASRAAVAGRNVRRDVPAGYSLNNLTLMALTISTGFVVDDAIVMIENIARYIEEGEPPMQAALKGAEQIGFTILSLTVSLIAVLIPLLFMGDIVGRLFREFAITLSVTILISAVVSLTLTPMMCARLLKHKPVSEQGRFYRASEHVFQSIIAFYGRTLQVILRHQVLTLIVAAGTLAGTVILFLLIPKASSRCRIRRDSGRFRSTQTISFPPWRPQQELAKIILKDPPSTACRRSSAWTAPTPPSTADASRSI